MRKISVYVDNKRTPIITDTISGEMLNHSLAHLTLKIDPEVVKAATKLTVKFSDVREED